MENFKKKVKEIFTKVKTKAVDIFKIVKAWVIAHKVPSIIIASVLAVAIILAIVLPIALRDKCKDGHAWDNGVVTKAATCGAAGEMTFTCTQKKCGETKVEAIAATGEHTYVDANCTTAKTCSVCNATEGAALGHTWKDATCEAPKTCSVCNTPEGEALGHNYVDTNDFNVVEGEEGKYACVKQVCANCNAEQNGAKLETYVVVEDAATLVIESGKTYILGETAMGAITLANALENVTFIGGKFDSIVVANTINGLTIKDAAFATEAGLYFFCVEGVAAVKDVVFDGCKFDGTNLTNNAINVHCGGAVENLTVTNCEFNNMVGDSICVYINGEAAKINVGKVIITNNKADNFNQRFVRTNGIKAGEITVSGNTLTKWLNPDEDNEIVKMTDLVYGVKVTIENNTLDGVACVEAETIVGGVIVHVHKWADATCAAPKTCTTCGATEGEAEAHTEEDVEAKAPTCTETGLTAGKKCSVCGAVTVEQTEVPATGHNYVDGKCSVCEAEEPQAPATGD